MNIEGMNKAAVKWQQKRTLQWERLWN